MNAISFTKLISITIKLNSIFKVNNLLMDAVRSPMSEGNVDSENFFITGTDIPLNPVPAFSPKRNYTSHQKLHKESVKEHNFSISPYSSPKSQLRKPKIHKKQASQRKEIQSQLTRVDPNFAKDIEDFAKSERMRITQCISNKDIYLSPLYISNKEHSEIESLRNAYIYESTNYNETKEKVRKMELKLSNLKYKVMPLKGIIDYAEDLNKRNQELSETLVENDFQAILNKSYINMRNRLRSSLLNMKKSISSMNRQIQNYNSAIVDHAETFIKKKLEIRDDYHEIKKNKSKIPELDKKFMSDLRQPLFNEYTNAIKYNLLKDHITTQKEDDKANKIMEIQSQHSSLKQAYEESNFSSRNQSTKKK